jgi:ATP-dependent Zn protease
MDDEFGIAAVDEDMASLLSVEIMRKINIILKEQLIEGVRIISENKDKMDLLVNQLLKRNHLSADEIESILK